MLRVLISGYRLFNDAETIKRELLNVANRRLFVSGVTVLHGGCSGTDETAARVASELGWQIEAYPAKWHKYGLQAGPRRNQKMITKGRPHVAVLFLSKHSRGTKDMLQKLHKTPIETRVIEID